MFKYGLKKGKSLSDFVKEKSIKVEYNCGSNHTCGKCKFRVVEGIIEPNEIERKLLSKQELNSGFRLACTHDSFVNDIVFEVEIEKEFAILGLNSTSFLPQNEHGYGLAVDLGTTTVVLALVNLETGMVEEEHLFINPQRVYGLDVISRIAQCSKESVEQVQQILLVELRSYLSNFESMDIKRMVVSGNPTMTHIFMGVDPASIAKAPYLCSINELTIIQSQQILKSLANNYPIYVLPPISAYVGADVVMGIYESKLMNDNKKKLFIDLGTNGEIVLYDKGKFLVSSAACGPAFEGGNMVCGKGAIKGAIDNFEYAEGWKFTTIGNKEAIGICGSGYTSLISLAFKQGIIEDNGYLPQDIVINNSVYLSAKDVREFQMAKSAIAAAIMCLLQQAKISASEIDMVYIAGGFGKHINLVDLFTLGILPMEFEGKIQALGNTAIKGTCDYLLKMDAETLDKIIHNSTSVLLANNQNFTNKFMEHMMFGEFYENNSD